MCEKLRSRCSRAGVKVSTLRAAYELGAGSVRDLLRNHNVPWDPEADVVAAADAVEAANMHATPSAHDPPCAVGSAAAGVADAAGSVRVTPSTAAMMSPLAASAAGASLLNGTFSVSPHGAERPQGGGGAHVNGGPVSYTHLTLPTILLV